MKLFVIIQSNPKYNLLWKWVSKFFYIDITIETQTQQWMKYLRIKALYTNWEKYSEYYKTTVKNCYLFHFWKEKKSNLIHGIDCDVSENQLKPKQVLMSPNFGH